MVTIGPGVTMDRRGGA